MSANLFDLLLERAPRRDKLAIDAPDGLSLTYGELFARAGRAARALVERGVEPGDRVAAQIDKSPDAIVLALACFKARARRCCRSTPPTRSPSSNISSPTPRRR